MNIRPYRNIKRKNTKLVNVGKVKIGNLHPISVQSMTNTQTTDTKATITQINNLAKEGADLVRSFSSRQRKLSSFKRNSKIFQCTNNSRYSLSLQKSIRSSGQWSEMFEN